MAAANLALGSEQENHWTNSPKMAAALDYTLALWNN